MSPISINPRLNRRLKVRKEFPQGFFNRKLKGFDAETGYYSVKYEDGDSEEMSEDEVFSAARAYRNYHRHKGTCSTGVKVQVAVPKTSIRRRSAIGVQPSVRIVPVKEESLSLVPANTLHAAQARKNKFIKLCEIILFLWGAVHLVYTFVTRFIGRD